MSTLITCRTNALPTPARESKQPGSRFQSIASGQSVTVGLLTISALICFFSGPAAVADQSVDHQIHGTIIIDNAGSYVAQPNERLVLKFYFPDQGIEKDQTFRIFNEFAFPFEFHNGPDLDMSRRTKWSSYVVEAFTDIDGDVLTIAEQEFFATSQQPVAVGSEGLVLKLVKK